jgi:hypothetical protein
MKPLFLFFSLALSFDFETPPPTPASFDPCPGPHAILDASGVCECPPDYPFGDPDELPGCWQCPTACHEHGHCVHPGICQCNHTYEGDGLNYCDPILPHILEVYPNSGSAEHRTPVTIAYSWDAPGIRPNRGLILQIRQH